MTALIPYHIILTGENEPFRRGIRRIIENAPDLKVISEVTDSAELLRLLDGITSDMVILDISTPDMRWIEAVGEIKARHPRIRILLFTMHRDKEYLYQALASGADGYMLKEDADSGLITAIRKILNRGTYVSASLSTELVDCMKRMRSGMVRLAGECDNLTNREKEVLKIIAEGKTSRQCAGILCISVRTVEHHRSNIMDKLRLNNTADLVKYAINRGYV